MPKLAELAGDVRRRVGPAGGACGLRHARETCGIVEQACNLRNETIGIELALANDDGRAALRDVLGIGRLMRLGRGFRMAGSTPGPVPA